MLKTLILSTICLTLAFAGEAVKSPADVLYDKAVADNTRDAEKAYDAYVKALEAANKKVIAALEAAKKDLNDPKKGKLTITERAAAIAEFDAKIKSINDGAVGSGIVEKRGAAGDLLGEKPLVKGGIIGKWGNAGKINWEFNSDGTGFHYTGATTYTLTWTASDKKVFTMVLNGPSPDRKITLTDAKTITVSIGADQGVGGQRFTKAE